MRNWRNCLAELCDWIDNTIALTGQAKCLPHLQSQTVDLEWWRRPFRLRINAHIGADAQRQAECLPHHHSPTVDPEWWRRRFRLRINARIAASAQLEKLLG
jgi:hypothetical protein